MTDLGIIPLAELLQDFEESLDDVMVCAKSLESGIKTYSGGKVIERLEKNIGFVRVIFAEIRRRENEI